jgi:hypothetical protein
MTDDAMWHVRLFEVCDLLRQQQRLDRVVLVQC